MQSLISVQMECISVSFYVSHYSSCHLHAPPNAGMGAAWVPAVARIGRAGPRGGRNRSVGAASGDASRVLRTTFEDCAVKLFSADDRWGGLRRASAPDVAFCC